ncbi:MAG: hypothetical protein CME70_11850 [Halobacteriovorax sp.]|nr:hypothetical protein [Halobacteriovorax sp.]|tara:strand:- start:8093 stop:8515 length:423 start_codon:yes stop_codon:yes gene_type:complete
MFGSCLICQEEAVLNFHEDGLKCDTCTLGAYYPHLKFNYSDQERKSLLYRVISPYKKKKNRKKFKGLKEELWKREPLCQLCHRWIRRLDDASLDHILPLGAGGEDEKSNIQLTHKLCNEIKGCKPIKRLPKKLIPKFKDL